MAEKSLCLAESDQDSIENVKEISSKMNSESLLSSGKSEVPVPSILSVPSSSLGCNGNEDSSSDESNVEETQRLKQHQASLRHRSYASAAAEDHNFVLRVSLPDANNGLGRPRPRTVFVEGSVSPRALINKLKNYGLIPQQIQGLLNSEIAVTFKSVAEKQSFLNLDFVTTAEHSSSRPVWVRVHFKPAELESKVVYDKLCSYGTILFSRENKILGTDILSGSLTFKMRLRDPIPSFVYIGPICLAVNYDGQSPTCRKCDSTSHIARSCYVKRCFNCGKSGHLNRQCPEPIKCQGCQSQDHCFEQCPSSWQQEEHAEETDQTDDRINWNWNEQGEEEQLSTETSNKANEGSLVIDELGDSNLSDSLPDGQQIDSAPLGEMPSGLKRTRDTDEASIVTVSRRRPGRKKVKENIK